MWLFLPVVFAVLGFGSVAYSESPFVFSERRINGKALYDGFSVNLEAKDLKSDDTLDDGSGTSEPPVEEFAQCHQTDETPASGDCSEGAPEEAIISGFNVNTGTFGSGTDNAIRTGFSLQPPGGGFDVATGTFGRGVPERNAPVKPLTLQEAIPCYEKSPEPKITWRNGFWIFHNYVPMSTKVSCWESVTYVTHARWFELIHISPLVERWRAPISVAVSTRSVDFEKTLDSIRYLRSCTSPLVSQYVTFHLYFGQFNLPDNISEGKTILAVPYNCRLASPLEDTSNVREVYSTFAYYPNLGRNIAKENALTYYHIVANIDTYPSANLASDFLDMIKRDDQPETSTPNPRVFVLPPFEVLEGETVPFNKTELIKMLNEGKVVPLPDKDRCPLCQNTPEAAAWRSRAESDALGVLFVGKRTGPFKSWEPIFIGTDKDPMYMETILEEGIYDRRVQGLSLCKLDYDFLILDNAFVVRSPGTVDLTPFDEAIRSNENDEVKGNLVVWYRKLYGDNPRCAL